MSTDRHQRVRDLFEAALAQPGDARAGFLETAAADRELVREVESLLAAHADASGFMEIPPGELGAPDRSMAGRRIGPYELIRELARGGMGSVYVARRADDTYNRRVAIKLIRPGMDTAGVLERFRVERQILAALDHPNIARLLDGGATPEGLPYLVMEYVEGRPIDEACEANNLTIRERLEMFRTVCDAVSHAHHNLVVHRDLKPANILVTATGVPKLLDFGIAKLLNPDMAGVSGAPTVAAMRMMTPEYASPEQARGDAITTASDVYSLGVVLYELLTGKRPYEVRGLTPGEVERTICESEPSRPSYAVRATRPSAGRGPVDRLRRHLEGDLDNIVLMAIRKEPQHRYATVDRLSEDVGCYLRHLPVRARKGGWTYYARKFVRRNRVAAVAGALAVGAMAVGIVATSWQASAARRERAKAERLVADVRSLTSSFLFEFHDAIENLPGATPARELVVRRALEYLDRLASDHDADPSLQLELASGYARLGGIQWTKYYANLGDITGAAESQRRALALREQVVAADSGNRDARRALGFSYVQLGDALASLGSLEEALELYRKSLAVREVLATEEPGSRADARNLAVAYQRLGDILGNPSQENFGDWAGAHSYFQRMQDIFERQAAHSQATAGDRHSVGIGYEKLGRVAAASGDLEGALGYYRKQLESFRADYAADSTNVQHRRDLAVGFGNVGDALANLARYQEALKYYADGRQIRAEVLAADPRDMGALRDLAFIDRAIGFAHAGARRRSEALAWLDRAAKALDRVYVVDANNRWIRGQLVGTLQRTAAIALEAGDGGAARSHAGRALDVLRRAADAPEATGAELNEYAWTLLTIPVAALQDPARAVSVAERAVAASDGKEPNYLDTLAHAYHRTGARARAIATAERVLEMVPPGHPGRGEFEATLATVRGGVA